MALTDDEAELYRFGRDALPGWLKEDDEFLTAAAKQFGAARALSDYLFSQALIGTATGPDTGTPDWLAQHARDRATSRQANEGDPALRKRLQEIPDALTRAALLAAADAILAAAGVVGASALLELPRDAAWLGHYTALTGTGGTFAQVATVSKFTPTVLWATPPFRSASVSPVINWQLVIGGAASAGNNGTRAIAGLEGNAALVSNAGGVAGADATVTWTARRLDVTGNVTDGFARSFAGRGWRCANSRPFALIVILPFGTSAGTAASVLESVRQKKAGGFRVAVERRLNP